jgi:hypothetical protein
VLQPEPRLRITLVQGTEFSSASASASASVSSILLSGQKLSATSRTELESLLKEAHAQLQLVPPRARASRAVTLVRFGPFEVRLVQPLNEPPTKTVVFWLELFDHDRQLSIDSIGDCTIDHAVIAVEDFIVRATKLNENPNAWRRPT